MINMKSIMQSSYFTPSPPLNHKKMGANQSLHSSFGTLAIPPAFSGHLAKDTVLFGREGKVKHKDLDTSAVIYAPADLEVRDSIRIGGLQAGRDISGKEVAVTGAVQAGRNIKFVESDAFGGLTSLEGDVYTSKSAHIGGIRAQKGNIKTYEVAVQGNVIADQGNIEFISSDIIDPWNAERTGQGRIVAGGNATVQHSKHINDIEAQGNIHTKDILAEGDVTSKKGNIRFVDSDSKKILRTLQGDVLVDDSDEINGIESAGSVTVKDTKEVKGPIHAHGDVTLRAGWGKKTVVRDDIVVDVPAGTNPTVDIGDNVTVQGRIIFENGDGQIKLAKKATYTEQPPPYAYSPFHNEKHKR